MQVNNIMIVNKSKTELYEIGIDELIEINAAPFGDPLDYKELNKRIYDTIRTKSRNIVLKIIH